MKNTPNSGEIMYWNYRSLGLSLLYKAHVQGSLLASDLDYAVIIVSEIILICRIRKHACIFTLLKSYRTYWKKLI